MSTRTPDQLIRGRNLQTIHHVCKAGPGTLSCPAPGTAGLSISQQLHVTVTPVLLHSPLWLFWDMGLCETEGINPSKSSLPLT